jgi:hypothetical protein
MVVDRYYESFPQFTMKGSIDGWYDQATTQLYQNATLDVYYCGQAAGNGLQGLRLLGVRYVMIDYGYGGQATLEIANYNSSNSVLGSPVYNKGGIAIYQIPNSQLVYVTGTPPAPLANSISSFTQDVSCSVSIPSVPPSPLNYSISNLSWGENRISFDVEANQSAFVLVSSSYSPGWIAEDNGSSVPISLTTPGFPVINVTSGLHHIVLYYPISTTKESAAILTLITSAGVLLVIPARRMKVRKFIKRNNR